MRIRFLVAIAALICIVGHSVVHGENWIPRPVKNIGLNQNYLYGEPFGKHIHTGVDFAAPKNTDITAYFNGTVVYIVNDEPENTYHNWPVGKSTRPQYRYGNYATVSTTFMGTNMYMDFGHQDVVLVKVGDDITRQGVIIGESGNSGYSTAQHLHVGAFILVTQKGADGKNKQIRKYINPELIFAPLSKDNGIIVGRAVDANDNALPYLTHVNIEPQPSSKPKGWYAVVYGKPANGSPWYKENYCIADIPAGQYTITSTQGYRVIVEIRASTITDATDPQNIKYMPLGWQEVQPLKSKAPLIAGTYHKQANSSAVYLATDDGRLWPVLSSEVLFALTGKPNDYSMVQNHPAGSLDQYQKGLTIGYEGSLYKDERTDPEYAAVYIISDDQPTVTDGQAISLGTIRAFRDGDTFKADGFTYDMVLPVPDYFLNKYQHGPLINPEDDFIRIADAYEEETEWSRVELAVLVDQGRVLGASVGPTDNTGSSSGAGNPEQYPTEISVEPTSISFGEVEIGESASRFITIKNIGRGNVEITAEFPYSPYLPQFTFASQRFTISPGDSQKVEAVFTPSSTLSIAGVFEINSSLARVSMSGRGKRTVPRQIITIKDTLSNGMILESIVIKAGSVLMGATEDDPYQKISLAQANERPQMLVTISKDFGLGKYEVTQGQWQSITGKPLPTSDMGGGKPAVGMSWNDINNIFLPKLNELVGGKAIFRIPTEAEWELAARDGTHTRWFTDKDPVSILPYAWVQENPNTNSWPEQVGMKQPSPNGLYDIYGNAAEMTRALGGYESRRYTDPPGLYGGMIRGGSWQDDFAIASSVYRRPIGPNDVDRNIGFRLLREIPDAPVIASVLPPETPAAPENTDSTATTTEPDSVVESSANSPSDSISTSPSGDSQTQSTEASPPPVVDQPVVVVEPPIVVIQPQPAGISLPAPTLISPPNNSTETLTKPDLVWTNSAPDKAYELQISVTPSFTPPMAFETYGGFEWSSLYGFANRVFPWSRPEYGHMSPLSNNTTFYWRVKPQGGDWSAVFRFTTVALPNHPPQFSAKPDSALRLSVGEPLRSELMATDADNDALSFSFASAPAFMRIDRVDSVRVRIRGVPALSDTGQYQIIAQVTDSKGATDTTIIPLRVAPPITAVEEEETAGIATSFVLSKNFPNPFNTETMIRYSLPSSGNVRLEAYDFLGQFVATLVNVWQEAGAFSVRWDGRDSFGREMPSGIYIYRFMIGREIIEARKMLLLK